MEQILESDILRVSSNFEGFVIAVRCDHLGVEQEYKVKSPSALVLPTIEKFLRRFDPSLAISSCAVVWGDDSINEGTFEWNGIEEGAKLGVRKRSVRGKLVIMNSLDKHTAKQRWLSGLAVRDSPSLRPENGYTLHFWFKPTAALLGASEFDLISKVDLNWNTGFGILSNYQGTLSGFGCGAWDGCYTRAMNPAVPMEADVWQTASVVCIPPNTVRLYHNSVFIFERTMVGIRPCFNSECFGEDLQVGFHYRHGKPSAEYGTGTPTGTPYLYQGAFGPISIWDRALSEAELITVFAQGTVSEGLVLDLRFDEEVKGHNARVVDYSGKENHGFLCGEDVWVESDSDLQ